VTDRRSNELAIRTLAGAAMIAVALAAIILGGIVFWLLMVVIALFMMAEWSDLQKVPIRHKRLAQYALSVPLAITAPASLILQVHDFFTLGLLAGAAFFVVIVTRNQKLALGILYCGLPVLSLMICRRQHAFAGGGGIEGIVYTLWALALVWATDIGAYFAGRTIGGPKLAPRLSPSKTWAGLVGGVVLASAFGAFMHAAYGLPLRMTLATPALAVLAQMGDLYESGLKRRAGVKDSGNILPGHGGLMDRLDGLVPVAPAAALLVVLPHFYALIGR
jgi:CDP-diglyceride synthetase